MGPKHRYVSEAEFLALPPRPERVELLDGELVVSPSPSHLHQWVSRELFRQLVAWESHHGAGRAVLYAPLDVRFGEARILQPDLVVLPRRPAPWEPMPVDLRPDLVIEILSSNPGWDRHTKRFVYAGAGVPEYWVVDPEGFVEVFSGPHLKTRVEVRDRVVSVTLTGLEVDLGPVFGQAGG